MKKSLLLFFVHCWVVTFCNAQFFYKDILATKEAMADLAIYKEQKITKINLKSTEYDGLESEGFYCVKNINKKYTKVEVLSRTAMAEPSVFTSYFSKAGFLEGSVDSSTVTVTRSTYTYNIAGNIERINIKSYASDEEAENIISEDHVYIYENSSLNKMYRIKNNADTVTFVFLKDEEGNIGIEKNTTSGETYYYYYDNKHRLTDVVKQNEYNGKMLPDYIFEYNAANQITQMTSVQEGSNNYFIWRYTYGGGLRLKEKCYSKQKRLLGTIEYEYK
jgi:hypothetical protein